MERGKNRFNKEQIKYGQTAYNRPVTAPPLYGSIVKKLV